MASEASRMWSEDKIPGLGCYSVCSPPKTLMLRASGQLLRGILSDLPLHTKPHHYWQLTKVYTETHMQTFMYALCVHEAETRMQIKCTNLMICCVVMIQFLFSSG